MGSVVVGRAAARDDVRAFEHAVPDGSRSVGQVVLAVLAADGLAALYFPATMQV